MSIIYDALKKVEKNRDLLRELKKKRISTGYKITSYVLYAIVIVLGLFTGNMFFGSLAPSKKLTTEKPKETRNIGFSFKKSFPSLIPAAKKTKDPVKEITEKPAQLSSMQTKLAAKAEAKRAPQLLLVLNGVFFSRNKGYALINNRIVKEGDKISTAVVKKISLDKVELDNAGELIMLSTQEE